MKREKMERKTGAFHLLVVHLLAVLQASSGAIFLEKFSNQAKGSPANKGLITREAQQTLLDHVIGDIGLIGEIVPVRRPDLPADYVAYVEVTFPALNSFMLLSTGPETGDYRLPVGEDTPSMTQLVRDSAKQNGAICSSYTLLAPELMMCDDVTGMAAGSSIPLDGLSPNTSLADLIDADIEKIESKWQDIKQMTSDEWLTSLEMTEKEFKEWIDFAASTEEQSYQSESYPISTDLSEGDNISIAVGDPEEFVSMEILPIKAGENEKRLQRLLCDTVRLCDSKNPKQVASSSIKVDDQMGLLYTQTRVDDTSKMIKAGEAELDFLMVLHLKGDKVVVRQYSIKAQRRQKRGLFRRRVRRCSGWTERHVPCSQTHFPDYNQHRAGRCAVGCGPTAWAMVFGFYDRASHASCGHYSSQNQNLYKCGGGGLTGSSSCIAPRYGPVQAYTEKLNDVMRTFCAFENGATLERRMDDVEPFFRERVHGASIQSKDCFLTGIYCDKAKNWAKSKLDAGWPVVIGYRLKAFSWHYSVATGYRYRRCEERRWFRWRPFYQYDWFLHMGWGYGSTEWRDMKAYAAWTAEF